jgi:predicted alpha/beta superfamily hydrolase
MHADGYPWEHEIRVALPRAYADTTRAYPVLWVTDNALEFALPVLGGLELIVVSVGASRLAGGTASPRRAYDFFQDEDIHPPGAGGDFLRERNSDVQGGGAARFLEFLVDEVRPVLAGEYRMDPSEHGLTGYSAGGWFVLYAMFMRPQAFAKYLAGAPAVSWCNGVLFEIEERFAAENDDLAAQLFCGIGDSEMTVDAVLGCLSSMAKMVELLTFRAYPSLDVTVKLFAGETHATTWPLAIGSGTRALWGDKIAPAL